jgi:hypothetical protein
MNSENSASDSIWRRRLLGIFALLLLGTAGVMFLRSGEDESQFEVMMRASLLRGGLLVAAFWLAFPQLRSLREKLPTRTAVIGTILIGTLVVQPRLIVVVGPLLAVYGLSQSVRWLFTPFPSRQSPSRQSPSPPKAESRRE